MGAEKIDASSQEIPLPIYATRAQVLAIKTALVNFIRLIESSTGVDAIVGYSEVIAKLYSFRDACTEALRVKHSNDEARITLFITPMELIVLHHAVTAYVAMAQVLPTRDDGSDLSPSTVIKHLIAFQHRLFSPSLSK